ncbi:accessory gene regulator B family protein [Candidatus Enterococcus courvalinii]|uniref:Accessory gene regulator B family protein n=1 Tax=Candidatus Enterococcus courvalinii TaxID=2815329 RepID=A0ABS3HXS0_9ENTE|nr:accessory gene regulator B family protein [Enterococcus sp. MSG2901]MBO0481269.1 accessory gene regulator B family protein [Enterococcus sp. MSG2901]
MIWNIGYFLKELEEILEERIASILSTLLCTNQITDPYKKAQINYGIEILIVNLSKIIVIFLFSTTLFSLKATLTAYVPYCILRRASFGYHAKTSISCTILSIIAFSIVPCFIANLNISATVFQVLVLTFLLVVTLFITAPSFTKENEIKDEGQVKKLKKCSIILGIFLMSISTVFSSDCSILIIYGTLLATCLTIPNEILKRKCVK